MKTPCPSDQLDALARGELTPLPAQRLLAHVRGCAACRSELAWLRAERRLADEHARDDASPPPELWHAVASRVGLAPVKARRAVRPAHGVLLVALASAALAIASWPRPRPPALAPDGGSIVRPEPPPPAALASSRPAPEPVVLRALNVSKAVARPITLSLGVGEATVDVSPCGGNEVSVTLSDTRHDSLSLQTRPGPGGRGERVELLVDDGLRLESGQARVSVPRGTRLEVITSAGEQFVTEVTATTRVVGAGRPP
ncbi:MAG TPA: zf-HC2 domain-containing protein [Polyangiaceae bacterium]|nr:zf-HC2 domain-containing protein [Polyangiaceae bacterium]